MLATTAEQPSGQWKLISEVSQMLGVDYDTILYTVHKAAACAEPWVARAAHPLPSSPVRWLIDITHPSSQHLMRRGRTSRQRRGPMQALASTTSDHTEQVQTSLPCEAIETCEPSWPQAQEALLELSTRCTCHGLSVDLTTAWPEFCQLLSEQGLIVFADALAPAARWQWVWQDGSGEGYADATDAIVAALSHHFTSHWDTERGSDAGDTSFLHEEPEETPTSSWWRRVFSRS